MLSIKNLHANVANNEILKGLNLEINAGEVHAIMGPNGSGKSTLSHVIAGKSGYTVTKGTANFNGESILDLSPEERANSGIFLAFQYPVEIPGVNNIYMLREALNSKKRSSGEKELSAAEFLKFVKQKVKTLGLKNSLLNRPVNDGFSGGEKKRNEIFQMSVLEPSLAILDETDSGLDIDALKIVSDGVNLLRKDDRAFIIVTHYQRLLDYIVPDFVHVLHDGKIVKSGDKNLAKELEVKGYDWLKSERKIKMPCLIEHAKKTSASLPNWIQSEQQLAEKRIKSIPFPNSKQEYWKYLPIEKLREINFNSVKDTISPDLLVSRYQSLIKNKSHKIFLSNGKIIKIDESLKSIVKTYQFSDCDELSEQFISALKKPRLLDPFFYSLNSRMLVDGLLLEVPEGSSIDHPIHIINLGSSNTASISSPRLIVRVAPNSTVKLIEEFFDLNSSDSLTNTVTQIKIEDNSNVNHDRIVNINPDNYHFGQITFDLCENAHLHSNSLALGGKITRVDLSVDLNKKGSECDLKGLYLCKGETIADHHTAIFHNSEHTKSSELYRGVINDKGLGVFNGKVVVSESISQISATQHNNNLLLSELASANTKPELQIYSDDVRCAHGATVGQLDSESLFYLRSRGIAEQQAQMLLIKGFIEEILSKNYQLTDKRICNNVARY